jgi:hypothetical protein
MYQPLPILLLVLLTLSACSGNKLEEKGFAVPRTDGADTTALQTGIGADTTKLETRPSNVLLTGMPNVRLATVYKVNRDKKEGTSFIGSNNYHENYDYSIMAAGDQWNNNYMPGIAAVYGYNLVNVAHFDVLTNARRNFFDAPVLVRTLYYPAFTKDTLNAMPVQRNYFMVSVHDEDTNKDGYLTIRDLRRFYWFNGNGERQTTLVPTNYSVFKSEYDPGNDHMFVFAQLDENGDGRIQDHEAVHVFWVDLKDPGRTGRVY